MWAVQMRTHQTSFGSPDGEQSGYGREAPGCLRKGEEGIVMYRRLLAMLVVTALVAALLPGAALAASAKDKDSPVKAGMSALLADTAPADAREPDGKWVGGGGVDTSSLLDLSDVMPRIDPDTPGWGMGPWTDARTIDTATLTDWDEDWYKLTVSAGDYVAWTQLSYRFDAYTMDADTDLVIDVYAASAFPQQADAISGGEDVTALVSNDDMQWSSGSTYGVDGVWASVCFTPPAAGDYYVRVRPYFHGGLAGFKGHAGAYTFRAKYGQVERLSGSDRIATAARIAEEGWPTRPAKSVESTVVIAYSQNYPDALSAASLAGACGSPVLLNGADHLSPTVATEIARLGFKKAYIIGGPAAISTTVENELKSQLGASNVFRKYGADRYQTAVQVLRETKAVLEADHQTLPSTAFLASGANFPDALALGPIAYFDCAPILLTDPSTLTPVTASELAMQGIDDVIIAGGTGAISSAVQSAVSDLGIPSNRVLRVSGADRYETAKEIAAWACDLKGPGVEGDYRIGTVNNSTALPALDYPFLNAFASGESYPDALAGGAFAGKASAPILLTRKNSAPMILFGADGEIPLGSTTWFTDLWMNGWTPIEQSYLLGGSAAVGPDTFLEIDGNTGESGAP